MYRCTKSCTLYQDRRDRPAEREAGGQGAAAAAGEPGRHGGGAEGAAGLRGEGGRQAELPHPGAVPGQAPGLRPGGGVPLLRRAVQQPGEGAVGVQRHRAKEVHAGGLQQPEGEHHRVPTLWK